MSAPTKIVTQNNLETIRASFPLLETDMNGKPIVFLDSAASSQKPQKVLDALDQYYRRYNANVHRGVYKLSQEATDLFESSRRTVANFINAGSEREVIFVRGATEAINLVATTFGRSFLKQGDEILITGMEHHSNIVPWQIVCEQYGGVLKVVPVQDNGEIDLEEYSSLLTERTRLVAAVHVSNTLGTINPVHEMIDQAHQMNVPVLIDGAQGVPHMKIDVQDLDADFYVFSGHKMYAPTGIGILYGKEKWLEQLPPYHGGGEMIKTVTFEKTTYNELPFKFEAGTPNIAGSVGLEAAIQWMESVGHDFIQAHEAELLEYGTNKLSEVEGIRFYGTSARKASVISFLLEGVHPYDLGTLLDKMGIAVRTGHHCTQPLMDRFGIPGTVRASLGVYNNKNDLDRLVEGVIRAGNMLR